MATPTNGRSVVITRVGALMWYSHRCPLRGIITSRIARMWFFRCRSSSEATNCDLDYCERNEQLFSRTAVGNLLSDSGEASLPLPAVLNTFVVVNTSLVWQSPRPALKYSTGWPVAQFLTDLSSVRRVQDYNDSQIILRSPVRARQVGPFNHHQVLKLLTIGWRSI